MSINKVTFAGHSAVFLHAGEIVIGIDPWLKGNPVCPEELLNPEALSVIVLTHGHADHASDAVRLAQQYSATVVATYELANILVGEGVAQNQVVPMNKGGTVDVAGIRCTLTNAFHSSSYDTTNGPVYAGEACGAVISDGERSFYHAGDTCLFSDMKLIGERYAPDIAFLPIGDHFTMGQQEAARAAAWCGCKTAVPIHYKTFDLLEQSAETFRAECGKAEVEVVELAPGQDWEL